MMTTYETIVRSYYITSTSVSWYWGQNKTVHYVLAKKKKLSRVAHSFNFLELFHFRLRRKVALANNRTGPKTHY